MKKQLIKGKIESLTNVQSNNHVPLNGFPLRANKMGLREYFRSKIKEKQSYRKFVENDDLFE